MLDSIIRTFLPAVNRFFHPTEKKRPAPDGAGNEKGVTRLNKLVSTEDGVFLNGVRLNFVTQLDVKNISPDGVMEAVIHIDVHEADIQHKVK